MDLICQSCIHVLNIHIEHISIEHIFSQNYISMPANIYLFKVDNRNTEKRVKYVQSQSMASFW